MTLKELRIAKGLGQKECAEFLGMSTRNYRNYENDESRANTAKYNIFAAEFVIVVKSGAVHFGEGECRDNAIKFTMNFDARQKFFMDADMSDECIDANY